MCPFRKKSPYTSGLFLVILALQAAAAKKAVICRSGVQRLTEKRGEKERRISKYEKILEMV